MKRICLCFLVVFASGTSFAQLTAPNGTVAAEGISNLVLLTNTNPRLTILSSNGFVGIGTSSPTEALHINGGIRSNTGNFSTVETSNLSFFTAPTCNSKQTERTASRY